MNDIYQKHRFRRIQYLNLVYIIGLILFEGYLYYSNSGNLIVRSWLLAIAVVFLCGVLITSKMDRTYNSYTLISAYAMGILTLLMFVYVYFIGESETPRYLSMVFLFIVLGVMTGDRVYKRLAVGLAISFVLMLLFGKGQTEARIIYFILNLVLLIQYISRSRYYMNLNHDYYELFRSQKNLVEHVNEGYGLHEVIWNEDHSAVIDYRFLFVNDAFEVITGLGAHEVVGKRVLEVLPETESYWFETYENVVINQEQCSFINYAQAFDKYFKVTVYPVDDEKFATIFMDISENIKTEKELKDKIREAQKANEFRSQFLKDVNHKLRTPLNGMMGMAQLIALEELPETAKELFDVMMVEMDHTRNIINQIAEYIELKDDTYQITENDIRADIDLICQQAREGNSIEIMVESAVKEGMQTLYYERNVFMKVLATLIANGLKHSRSNKISIQLSMVDDLDELKRYMNISVVDFGKGINDSEVDMIFNQLHHQDFINIYRNEGHMSLPLCKELINHIGGDLLCSSSKEEGATFIIRLPIFDQIKK